MTQAPQFQIPCMIERGDLLRPINLRKFYPSFDTPWRPRCDGCGVRLTSAFTYTDHAPGVGMVGTAHVCTRCYQKALQEAKAVRRTPKAQSE